MQHDPDSFSGDRTHGGSNYDAGMVNQDRARQERLLTLAGWLHNRHTMAVRPHGEGHTEIRFTREDLGNVHELEAYALAKGDAGEQAMHRDVKELRDFGIDLEYDRRDKVWVSRAAPLNDDECRALAVAAMYVLVEDGSADSGGYHVPGAGLSTEGAELIVSYAPIIDLFVDAIRTRSPVGFTHRGSERAIDPWHVFMTDGRWYVVGRAHGVDDRRTFIIDAITEAEVNGRAGSFSIPREDFVELSRTVIDPDRWTTSEPIDVTLQVDPRLVGRAETLLGAERASVTDRSEWVPMTCTVRNVDAFLTRLWGLRARAVVTGPSTVRDRVIESLSEMA